MLIENLVRYVKKYIIDLWFIINEHLVVEDFKGKKFEKIKTPIIEDI